MTQALKDMPPQIPTTDYKKNNEAITKGVKSCRSGPLALSHIDRSTSDQNDSYKSLSRIAHIPRSDEI